MNSLQPVIEKLEKLYSTFNSHFYGGKLETPVITVSPDTMKGAYGWCTSWRAWTDQPPKTLKEIAAMTPDEVEAHKKEGYYEINICAEHIARSFNDIAETLLHEMVHLFNLQEGVQDTSRNGFYHNKHFKAAAEKHGLTVEKTPKYGYSETKLNDEAKAFVSGLDDMKFGLYRRSLPKLGASKTKQSSRKYICPCCGAIVRATKEVNIVCGDCDVPFEEDSE